MYQQQLRQLCTHHYITLETATSTSYGLVSAIIVTIIVLVLAVS